MTYYPEKKRGVPALDWNVFNEWSRSKDRKKGGLAFQTNFFEVTSQNPAGSENYMILLI
jgi:hypothetical protein